MMTVTHADAAQADTGFRPRLLYAGEFPPSNHHGGAILLRRLLGRHPVDRLTVIASRRGIEASRAHDVFDCATLAAPAFRWSFFPAAGKVLELIFVFASTLQAGVTNRAETLITIVQGRYYLAAALAAWLIRMPHVTIVHDNFLSDSIGPSGLVRRWKRYLTRQVLKKADHIYAVSPEMQRLVRTECGRNPEIQLPSSVAPLRPACLGDGKREGKFVVLFAGLIGYTVKDCLDLLVELIKSGEPGPGLQLHLYTAMSQTDLQTFGWDHPDVICKGWVAHSDLCGALADADVLFLPYSFRQASRAAVETAFPSKTADYLAAGKPLLVFGPRYSSLVRYASEFGFAEIVDEFSVIALAQGLRNIAGSPHYREELAAKALAVFRSNHDIETQQRNFYLTLRLFCRERMLRRPRASESFS